MSQKLFKQPMLSFLIIRFHRNMGSINSITHDAHPSFFFSQPIFIRAGSFDETLHSTTVSSRSVLLVTLRKGGKFPIPMKPFPAKKPFQL